MVSGVIPDLYTCDYAHESTNEGGVPSQTVSDEAMYGLGEILLDLLTFSSVPVDRAAFQSVRPLLDRYRLDFFVDDPTASPLDFIRQHISPLFPVSLVLGPRGLYPVMWLPDDQPDVLALVEGVGLSRVGLVEYEGDVWNEISLSYAPNYKGELRRKVTASGFDPPELLVDADVALSEHVTLSSAYTKASQTRYGRRAKAIETIVVYDRATASAIVSWMARAYCQPWRSIRYTVEPDVITRRATTRGGPGLMLGDYVSLTDSELSIARRAIVRGETWVDTDPEIDLLLIDGPPTGAE
jgi:hypothetical protein